MKTWVFLWVFCLSYLVSSGQFNETIRVSGEFHNASISSILNDLGKSFDVNFAFDSKAFRNQIISISFSNEPINGALERMLAPINFEFQLVNDTYVIYPKPRDTLVSDKELSPNKTNFDYTGRIVDQRDLVPLPFATITTLDGEKSAISNEQGYFTLSGLQADTVTLVVRYLGYLTRHVHLTPEFVAEELPIELLKDNAVLPLVTIFGEQPDIIELGVLGEGESIDTEIIHYLPNSGEPDALRTIQLLSGVSSSGESAADFHVRGGAADENLVILDGFTLYHVDHFFGVFSAFNSNSLKHVVLHKGVFDAKFGGRASSVLELSGKQGNFVQPEIKAELGLLASNFLVESPILGKRASLMISARRSYTDVIYSPLYKSMFNNLYNGSISGAISGQADVFGQPESPNFWFYDLAAKVGFQSAGQIKYSFSFFKGRDQLQINYGNQTADERFNLLYNDQSTWGNTGVSGRIEKQWKNGDFAEVLISYSSYQSELFGFDSSTDLLLGSVDTSYFDRNTQLQDLTLLAEQNLIRNEHNFSFGTEVKRFMLNASLLDSNAPRIDENYDKWAISLFGQDTYRPIQNLLVKAGLRLSSVSNIEKILIEPRVFCEYEVIPKFHIQGGVGINNQFLRRIRRQNLFLNSADEWAFAGENCLPVLSANHFTLGARFERNDWKVFVNGFFADKSGVVEDAKALTGLKDDAYVNDLLIGSGTSIGLESTITYGHLGHNGWLTYTLSRSQNQFDEQGVGTLKSSFDALHEINAVYLYKFKNWKFSGTFIFGSGRPFTESPGTYTLELINGVEQERVAFANVNSSRLPTYERVDFAVNYDLKAGAALVNIGVGVFNVLNHQNVAGRQYYLTSGMDEHINLAVRDLTHLGLTPTVRIGISW